MHKLGRKKKGNRKGKGKGKSKGKGKRKGNVSRLEVVCGLKWILIMMKKRKKIWNKKSIFFQLEYWKHLLLCYNLDIMHIDKTVCDSVFGRCDNGNIKCICSKTCEIINVDD